MKPLPPSSSASENASAALARQTSGRHTGLIPNRLAITRRTRVAASPPTTPATTPQATCWISAARTLPLLSPSCSPTRASATASSGTQMPSFRPLSVFRPWRMRDGSLSSVTTAWPRAASVGARMTASRRASGTASCGSRTSDASEPGEDRERQPDREQTQGDRRLAFQQAHTQLGGVRVEHQHQGRGRDGLEPVRRHRAVQPAEAR